MRTYSSNTIGAVLTTTTTPTATTVPTTNASLPRTLPPHLLAKRRRLQHANTYLATTAVIGARIWCGMVCSSQTSNGKSRREVDAKRSEAIDKNEVSTESLGLGSFPTLSTVSYSTNYPATTTADWNDDGTCRDACRTWSLLEPREESEHSKQISSIL
jgi:hypothetical protein